MKWLTGSVIAAGVLAAAAAAHAQVLSPYRIGISPYVAASDVYGPYAAIPQDVTPNYGPSRYAPPVLLPQDIYAIIRESGFSPLGAPQQRGFVYTISVIDAGGEDGRLVIDARSGRIVRFMPAFRMGDRLNSDISASYGPPGPLPGVTEMGRGPRPPEYVPRVVSRTPQALPQAPLPQAAVPRVAAPVPQAPVRQAPIKQAVVQPKPAQPNTVRAAPDQVRVIPLTAAPAATAVEPTQAMPPVQSLE